MFLIFLFIEEGRTPICDSVPLLKRLALYVIVGVVGFVLGVFALYTYWVRSGPSLEIWHTEVLDAEYSADKAGNIRTFDAYRQLEAKLFSQLNEKIYARTDTGPEFLFARYSADSAADPRRQTPNWNRSFELPAKKPCWRSAAAPRHVRLAVQSQSPWRNPS